MNKILITGITKSIPQDVEINERKYAAMVVYVTPGTYVPIWGAGKIASEIKRINVGSQVEITGEFITRIESAHGEYVIRIYLFAKDIKVIKYGSMKYAQNMVFKTLFLEIMPDNLLLNLEKIVKRKKCAKQASNK